VRSALAEAARNVRVLHLACHGEFLPDDPLSSWLEIGPGERLSAADVLANYKLQADLVTLSACRSGVYQVLRGDEPMGLVRAFLAARGRSAGYSRPSSRARATAWVRLRTWSLSKISWL